MKLIKLYITLLLVIAAYFGNAQDTAYQTYTIKHDTLVSTHIPDKIVYIGDSTFTLYDTSYLAYSIYKTYWIVDGAIVVTIPLYDTIPEHDSVFICSLCAVHDTTIIVIIPHPETAINGMFPNLGQPAPSFGVRINTAKNYSCNAYRLNIDVGQVWRVKQVHDSGMVCMLTYNDPPCCNLNYFNTGAALETAKANFRAYLAANPNDLPEVISFNNEEPNLNYWKGTPQDYLLTLNALTAIAHEYGIPTSNGGILQPFIYYMRWVYKQEGKLDSAALLTKRGNLFPNDNAGTQQRIDWYRVLIPGIAASNVDYVNFHWYEPAHNILTTSDTTTGLLPLVIQFLRDRTGKPVITTEFGSKYDSQSLFNQQADEIDDSGVKMRVYFYGIEPGPVSDPHPEFWKSWIDQHAP